MAISTEILVRQYFNVAVSVSIAVDYPLYAETEVRVLYGNAGVAANRNADFEVHLGADFSTFEIVPLQALIDKIDALIVADPTEQNVVVVRRKEPMTTSSTPAAVRDTTFTSTEFDRVWMALQQAQDAINRSLVLSETSIRSAPLLLAPLGAAGNILQVGADGQSVVSTLDEAALVGAPGAPGADGAPGVAGPPGPSFVPHALTLKGSVVDADELVGSDSALAFASMRATFASVKTWVKSWIAKADVGLNNVDNTSDVTKWAAAVALTNKVIDASLNTISNITTAMFAANVVDTDATLTANSNSRLPSQAAIKAYVDGKVSGVAWKASVRAATTANGTLATAYANGQTIDGVVLVTGDRIFLKNQTTAADNGIYTANASGAPTRATDANTGALLKQAAAFVEEGTVNADTGWLITNNGVITVGTTALTVAQFSGAGTYTASGGLGITGNVISITDAILNAFRGLTGAANQLAYFTGASAMAVTSLTAYGISLIGAANATAVKTLLVLVKGDVGLGNVDNTSDATKNSATATLTNKRVTPRIGTVASSATPTPDGDNNDEFTVTAQAAAAAFAAPTGTPTDGQKLIVRVKDNGTARALTWNAIYRIVGVTLPTTTVISKTLYVGFIYNGADTKWDAVAVAQEA